MQRPKNSMHKRGASPRSGRPKSISLSKVGSNCGGVPVVEWGIERPKRSFEKIGGRGAGSAVADATVTALLVTFETALQPSTVGQGRRPSCCQCHADKHLNVFRRGFEEVNVPTESVCLYVNDCRLPRLLFQTARAGRGSGSFGFSAPFRITLVGKAGRRRVH